MSDFTIRNFNSNVKEDLDFFHAVHNSAIEIIPKLKDVLKPETDEYQMFIAVIYAIAFEIEDSLEVVQQRFVYYPLDVINRWQDNEYTADNNPALTVAVNTLRYYENISLFFKAYDIPFTEPIINALKDKVAIIFNKIYGPGINETTFFKDI